MTDAQFAVCYEKYDAPIRAIARLIAKTNNDLCDDLYQEGIIALWKLDLAKVKKNERACVLQAARNRMIDFIRNEKRESAESLTVRFAQGDQVITDETGSIRLIEGSLRRRSPDEREEDEEWWERGPTT